MFDEELPKPSQATFSPLNLENMSISDLGEYITALTQEIKRVEDDIEKKKASQNAAASVFKD